MRWPLLDSLSDDDRARVLTAARRQQFERGDVAVREGEPADCMHLVESGVFGAQVSAPGGERAMLNVLAPGEFFGELALVTATRHAQRTATILALVPAQTLTITAQSFSRLRAAHPGVERLLVTALAQRVDQLSGRLLEALYTGVDQRVYRRLVELAKVFHGATDEPVIPVSQEDLATMAGASRPTVNQVLQRLVEREIISLGRREIAIRDLAGLHAAAEADETT